VSDPTIVIRLDGNGRTYRPQEVLAGEYWFPSLPACQVKAIEVSVLWYTEGKGDEDLAVHEFWRHDVEAGNLSDLDQPERFQTTLPNSPLSYDGQIVKLRWCVRVRAFLHRGKEVLGEKTFRLGDVPPLKAAAR
jgi:hypothetical protein